MTTCRHCGEEIELFTFRVGEFWRRVGNPLGGYSLCAPFRLGENRMHEPLEALEDLRVILAGLKSPI